MRIDQLPEATESVEQQRLMQWARMEALMREGYAVSLCHGWEAAAKTIRDYLEMGETPECCKSCDHHREGKVQDCAVFRTTHGVKGGKCGMHSPI